MVRPHARAAQAVYAMLGFNGFATFQLIVGGTVLSALVHPLVLAFISL